jgi:hypothetical protein
VPGRTIVRAPRAQRPAPTAASRPARPGPFTWATCERRCWRGSSPAPRALGSCFAWRTWTAAACAGLTAAQRARRAASGRPPALRVRARGAGIGFEDLLIGHHEGVVDDFVVRRNDGVHAYSLAVVVDDAAQGIGQVVRGADLLDSTPRQLWLADRLGLPHPGTLTSRSCAGPTGRGWPSVTVPSRWRTAAPSESPRPRSAVAWQPQWGWPRRGRRRRSSSSWSALIRRR